MTSESDNWTKCSSCHEQYEDRHYDANHAGSGMMHPVTGSPICAVCVADMRCSVCHHVECDKFTIVSGQCLECPTCNPFVPIREAA